VTLVLGVDGGGSKTHAMVADERGETLGFASSGRSNWEDAGLGGARAALEAAITGALAAAGLTAAWQVIVGRALAWDDVGPILIGLAIGYRTDALVEAWRRRKDLERWRQRLIRQFAALNNMAAPAAAGGSPNPSGSDCAVPEGRPGPHAGRSPIGGHRTAPRGRRPRHIRS